MVQDEKENVQRLTRSALDDTSGKSLPLFPDIKSIIRTSNPDPSKKYISIKDVGENLDDVFCGYDKANSKVLCYSKEKIIFRKNFESLTNQVRIISSGVGLWGDFVGAGMLTCMVQGAHCPPTHTMIYKALDALSKTADKGILAIVPNNFHDKLNWGMAIAKAQRMGIHMDHINFGDNCNEEQEVDGRTCLPGIVLCFKLAGAMAEEKRTLKFIVRKLKPMCFSTISCHFSTRGVTLGTDLDGKGGWEMEGARRIEVMEEVVSCLLDPEREYSVAHFPETELVLFINMYTLNWSLSQTVAMEILQLISRKEYKCGRIYAGSVVPSVSQGFSITVLSEDCKNLFRWLDHDTTCSGWLTAGTGDLYKYQIDTPLTPEYKGISFSIQQAALMRRVIDLAASSFRDEEDYLNSNDCHNMFGTNMCEVISSLIKDSDSNVSLMQQPYAVFTKLATSFEDIFNNNDGIMFALFSTIMGQYFSEHSRPSRRMNERVWLRALQRSVKSTAAYFKISYNDNTLLDVFGLLYLIMSSSELEVVTDLHVALEMSEKLCAKAKCVKSKGIIDCPHAMMKSSCIILDAIAMGLRERLDLSSEDIYTTPNLYIEKIKENLLAESK